MVNLDRFDRLSRYQAKLRRKIIIRLIPISRLKDRENPLESYDVNQFKKRFHLEKETVCYIMSLIQLSLKNSDLKRGVQLPPIIKFLAVLRYFCTGSFQLVIGDLSGVSQSEMSILIQQVSLILAKLTSRFVKFPTLREAPKIRDEFFAIAGFPGVTGAVDGCHIQICSPGGKNTEIFRNRKGHFSINVQGICDASLNFTSIVVKWYGSAHDSRIFENSTISIDLENGTSPGMLLGDSGYPLLGYLMTPLPHPNTPEEKRYNYAQICTRTTIERTFGVWKRRFPVLNFVRVKLRTCLNLILATSVLHNISRKRLDLYENDYNEPANDSLTNVVRNQYSTLNGRALQKSIILSNFRN